MPAPPPDPMDGMGLGVDHLLDMSPGTSGAPNAPPPGSLATPGAVVTDLLLNGHPSGLPLGTFAAVTLPLVPEQHVRDGAVRRAARGGRTRACPHPGCAYVTDQGAARLATHARTHLDERPFSCAEPGCGKRFKTKEHLRQHANAHVTLRSFRCARELCVRAGHAPFKSAAEVALHARRVHTLDAAERRELRHLDKIRKLEAALAEAQRDGETLRAAADALKGALEEVTRVKKRASRKGSSGDGNGDGDGRGDAASVVDPPRTGSTTNADADADADADAGADAGAVADADPDRNADPGGEKKRKKPYTLSASSVLRVAEQTAAAARRAWRAEREATGWAVSKKRRNG